ncbi:MAG: YceI family protein [Polyangiaceae bacterium]
MNKHGSSALSLATFILLGVLGTACAKKDPPKPVHTEPWLAHPPASAAASATAAQPLTRYTLSPQSQIKFEVPSKHGTLHGSFRHITGEFGIDPRDLARAQAQIQVDLGSLTLSADGGADDQALLARAKSALGFGSDSAPSASFELSSLEDVSPAQLEPAPDSQVGAPVLRRARGTAVGNLLLHGFRVLRRAPLAAEFSFAADKQVPSSVVIRSRVPLVISLDTHEIRVPEAASGRQKTAKGSTSHGREARVSVELYCTKID